MASTLRHDSHPDHPLVPITDINTTGASCRACDLPFKPGKDPFGCRSCGFFLHRHCCHLETLLRDQPAHPQHPLRLLCTPANSRDPYQCNICGKDGKGFRYHCQTCGHYNVHMLCIKLPQQIRSPAHRQHPLQLLYPPLATGRTCCNGCGHSIQHACYGCIACNFFLHLECLKRNPMIGSSSDQQAPTATGVYMNHQQAPTATGVDMNHQQAPTRTPKISWLNVGVSVGVGVVSSFLGHQAYDFVGGDGFLGDGAWQNNDVHHGGNDFCGDMPAFEELPSVDGCVDDTLQEEADSLAFAHMESMSGGDGFGMDGDVGDPLEAEGTDLALAHLENMSGGDGFGMDGDIGDPSEAEGTDLALAHLESMGRDA